MDGEDHFGLHPQYKIRKIAAVRGVENFCIVKTAVFLLILALARIGKTENFLFVYCHKKKLLKQIKTEDASSALPPNPVFLRKRLVRRGEMRYNILSM